MASFVKPMLMGAGIGALGGLLTGQNPLKAAALGGATGGLLGSMPAGAMNLSTGSIPNVASTMSSVAPNAGVGAFVDDIAMAGGMATDPLTGQVLASTAPNAGISAFTQQPSMFDSLAGGISPYMNVRDLTGAAQVAAQYQQRPQMPTSPAGGISRGQAPQGTDVMALLQTIKQPERRRISLV